MPALSIPEDRQIYGILANGQGEGLWKSMKGFLLNRCHRIPEAGSRVVSIETRGFSLN